MWKKTAVLGSSKNLTKINDGVLRKPELTVGNVVANCSLRNASSDVPVKPETPEPLRSGLQASFPRGTGGRQSFSGNVCTVFGASGFFGKYVINKLGREGTQVIIPYRADPYWVRHLKTAGDLGQILFFPFDLKDEDSIRKVVRYSNVVINMIGRDYETINYNFNDVNAEGARRIARISREMGVKRLIHLSALNASKTPPESYIPGGSGFLRSKALGEEMVRDEFPDAIIVRPSDVFGYADRFFFSYCYQFRKNIAQQMCLHQCGENVYKGPVFVSNVAQGIMQLLHDPTTDGKVYEFVGPYWYQLGDLVDWIMRVLHRYESPLYMRRHIDAWTVFKINLMEYKRMISKRQYPFDWDKIERTESISDELTGCPTLTDLGVRLDTVEEKVPPMLSYFDKFNWYKPEIGEFPEPPWPTRLKPLRKKTTASIFELYGDSNFQPTSVGMNV